jgi:hypothetical protein
MKKVKHSALLFCILAALYFEASAQAHRVRIQIQGDDISSEISSTWERNVIMTKQDAMEALNQLWDKLSPSQKKEREDAYRDAKNYIGESPVGGRTNQGNRSFQQSNRRVSNARIDFEINKGAAFSNDRHIVYIRFIGNDFSSNPVWAYDDKYIVTKKTALAELEKLWRNCNSDQKRVREDAYKKAMDYINSSNVNGRESTTNEFTDSKAKNGEKIVIVIDKGAAFSD